MERSLLRITGVSLVAVALDSPTRGFEHVGVHGEPFLPKSVFPGSVPGLEPGIIWLRFCDGTMPS